MGSTATKFPKVVPDEWIRKCPLFIRAPKHYRRDGSCKCDDISHVSSMRRWGYKRVNGKWQ